MAKDIEMTQKTNEVKNLVKKITALGGGDKVVKFYGERIPVKKIIEKMGAMHPSTTWYFLGDVLPQLKNLERTLKFSPPVTIGDCFKFEFSRSGRIKSVQRK